MESSELRRIRELVGLGVVEFGRRLGYRGRPNTISVNVRKMEAGRKRITEATAQRARALADGLNPFNAVQR